MKYQTQSIALGLTLAMACLGLPGTLRAQGAPGPMAFSDLDQNGDGVISRQEFVTGHDAHLTARAAQGAPMRGAANPPDFAAFDQNGDGQLTPAEFQAGRAARMQGGPGTGPGAGMGAGPGMGRGMGMGRNMPAFAEFDLNADGTLTETEFYEARAKRMAERASQGYPLRNAGTAPAFSAIDTDGNGRVTPEEFAVGQTGHRGQVMPQP